MSEALTYALDDPRPIAAEAPYTYFLPSEAELAALEPGDLVKLIFRPLTPDRKWDAERMWVIVDNVEAEKLQGRLDNVPDDVPGLAVGDQVEFERYHVVDCDWSDERTQPSPDRPIRREYWERCMVDSCVLNDGAKVHYLYREEPDVAAESDEYPDSGWRIQGDYRGVSDEAFDAREGDYVALGAVLNVDDSWLHLIDAPAGAAFIRDWEDDRFVPSE